MAHISIGDNPEIATLSLPPLGGGASGLSEAA
jgi:hypothetical protein